jgi:hypothetical protein
MAQGQDEESPGGTSREQALWAHVVTSLARVEHRLSGVEARLDGRLTPEQIVKIAIGFGLPILVLLLTGNLELARKLIGLF